MKVEKKRILLSKESGFISLWQRVNPPVNKPILILLHDTFRGAGNETEMVNAQFDGNDFYTDNGKKIHEKFIVGWRESE